ncbi:hypothetical protein FRC03_006472 [Tulasnella sp. 419]|nr:hypothetical protein FRC02_004552 [Tulasnella sp. 418]KAG8960515.1 hypothetical protein FRC03_006472 [Tulasnella sp. 419]
MQTTYASYIHALVGDSGLQKFEKFVEKKMEEEAIVNGVWNFILQHYLGKSARKFLVYPEMRTSDKSGRMDLIVFEAHVGEEALEVNEQPVIILEGKRERGQVGAIKDIRLQLGRYMDAYKTKELYGIGACGRGVVFLRMDGGDNKAFAFQKSQKGRISQGDKPDGFLDIVKDNISIELTLMSILDLPSGEDEEMDE